MEAWIIWGIIALVTLIIEVFTTGIAVICFSVGALAGMVAAFFGGSATLQITLFALASIAALVLLRPLIIKLLDDRSTSCVTNVDALVGRKAVVTQPFVKGEGRVSVDGDDWKAVCVDESVELALGDRAEIVEVNSVILTIKKL